MEMAIKEYLANFQETGMPPLMVHGVYRTEVGSSECIYIVTTRHVDTKEALGVALPHLIRGIASRYNTHFLSTTKLGAVWLVEWEGEDLALVYTDVTEVSGEEFPIREGAEVARVTLLSLVDERRREAFVVPKSQFRGGDRNGSS